MKKMTILGLVFSSLLFFSLVFVACDSGDSSTPELAISDFITLKKADAVANKWIPSTTFAKREEICAAVKADNPNGNLVKITIIIKIGGIEFSNLDFNISNEKSKQIQFTEFFWNQISTTDAGFYILEVYATDANGNKSNIKTTRFEVI